MTAHHPGASSHVSISLCDHSLTLQNMFLGMRTILFIGGLSSDKSVFAMVNEDEQKTRRCHVFQHSEPVCMMIGFSWISMHRRSP